MKIQLVLKLYDQLSCGKTVFRKDFCARNQITERTFYRYLRELSKFLLENRPEYILDVTDEVGAYFMKRLSGNKG